jgi:S-DNA-T family DNA segregation ATPase FtsK/SpoIIIE
VVANGSGSTSLLQRRLKIGYGRAARIIDQLHDVGVLGPPDGSRPREVMVSPAQLGTVLSGEDLRAASAAADAVDVDGGGPPPEGNTGTAPGAEG